MNPWFIAAGVMALVGLFQEFDKADKKNPTAALPAPEKKAGSTAPVTVNVGGSTVQSPGKTKKAGKPTGEVPAQPTSSGDG